VTVSFPLLNIGTGNTTNLVATLLPGGGVLAPSGPQTYGVLVPGGPTVARPFTFTVTGVCGGILTATLALQDGATNLGTVTFTIRIGATVGATSSFSNPTAIIIPATGDGAATGAPSNPYPSNINVAGIVGTVSKVTVQLFNFNHTFPGDVDVLLVGPGGQRLLLMSDVGGGTDAVNANLTFDDAAAPIGATVVSGTFSPTNAGAGDLFPAPAPAAPPDPQQLSVFNGVNPNGTWSLYVVDDAAVDTGNINGGWRLNISTTDPSCCSSPCTLSVPANIVRNNDPGQCGAVVNYPAPTFTGSCGVVTSTPPSGSFFPVGTTTVTVKGTRQDNTMTVSSFTVTVNAPTTTTVPPVEGQYSDVVTLKANVTNAVCPGGAVEFKVNGAVVGSAPVVNGMATLPYTVTLGADRYPVMATYSSSSPGTGSSGTGTLTVTKENAVVTPLESNPGAVRINSPGGTAGLITLCADIREVNDGSPGNISLATPVTFTLTPLGAGATITRTAATSGGGVGGTLRACVELTNVPANVYDVVISVGGNRYTGSANVALTVYDPSLGFVTGGGTIVRSGVKANFGFIVRPNNNGAPQGELLYIEHRSAGDVKLKSAVMQSLSIFSNVAVFGGRGTLNGVANHSFRVTGIDNGEPGSSDQFGLNVFSPSGAAIADLTFNPITLSVGNILVPEPPDPFQFQLNNNAIRSGPGRK
jgi:subtilisin-like proprotein convertase family protein